MHATDECFPRYYKYFSTKQFVYRGIAMRNHNDLLGVVGGVDGINAELGQFDDAWRFRLSAFA